jgi:serine/threonine-protein kinase
MLLAAAGGAGALAWFHRAKPQHPVPSLLDVTPAAATAALAPLHFTLRVTSQFDETVAQGLIISQGTAPTTRLHEGASVAVVVSLGPPPVTVPDLTGLSLQDGSNRLIGAGLKPGTVSYRYDNSPKGVVLSWAGQGSQLPKGSGVDLVVSNGPPVVAVPSVSNGSWAAAQAALAAANLTAVENDVFSTTVPKGQVISTNPAAGTSVPVTSKVTVNVSKGPDLVPVPDVHNDSVDAATQALQAAGFNVSGVTGNPTAKVTRTSPGAGAPVLRGSSVTLFTI